MYKLVGIIRFLRVVTWVVSVKYAACTADISKINIYFSQHRPDATQTNNCDCTVGADRSGTARRHYGHEPLCRATTADECLSWCARPRTAQAGRHTAHGLRRFRLGRHQVERTLHIMSAFRARFHQRQILPLRLGLANAVLREILPYSRAKKTQIELFLARC